MKDTISRQAAIDKFEPWLKVEEYSEGELNMLKAVLYELKCFPPARPDYREVLAWLLAYHLRSFGLHGNYSPHDVISWLINDFAKDFISGEAQHD